MTRKRRDYDRSFKEMAVKLSYERGNYLEVQKELEITHPLLRKWRKEYQKFGPLSFCGRGNGNQRLSLEQLKIRELKKKAKQSELKFEILKKGSEYLSQEKSTVFNFIENNEKLYSIKKMCNIFGVDEMRYRRRKKQFISETQYNIILKKEEITAIFLQFKKRYGCIRITKELQTRGYKISISRVTKFMKELGLRSIQNKKFKVKFDSNHNSFVAPNILNREFAVKEPSQVWVSDITYLRTKEGFLHLTIILDLFDRKIIGWTLSEGITTEQTIIPAWEMAITNRKITNKLIFHSDRGVQYTSQSFAMILKSHKAVIRSMSRKGNSHDNAVAESFFKSLKRELIYGNKLFFKKQMKIEIFEFIETWYNKTRIHSALNYKTIEEFNKIN